MQKKVSFVIYFVLLAICLFCLGFFAGARSTASEVSVTVGTPSAVKVWEPAASSMSQGKIDINTADADLLQTLPGIGAEFAARIIAYRDQMGGFTSVEQIMEVEGIGEKRFEAIKAWITVGGIS